MKLVAGILLTSCAAVLVLVMIHSALWGPIPNAHQVWGVPVLAAALGFLGVMFLTSDRRGPWR